VLPIIEDALGWMIMEMMGSISYHSGCYGGKRYTMDEECSPLAWMLWSG
jgi:hypothetical protein